MNRLWTVLSLLAALAATSVDAQIVVPEVTPLGKFVRISTQLEVPDDPALVDHELSWQYPAGCEVEQLCDGEQLLLVGVPGTHTITLDVKTRTYIERQILVPGPTWETDKTDVVVQVDRLPVDIDLESFAATFVIGDAPPTPEPDPPGPGPDPEPDPPEPEAGKRLVYIVRESEEDTPQLAGLFVALRAGQSATWLRNQGHKLTILDDDEGDGRGNRSPVLVKLDPALANVPLPALIITDTDGKVLAKATITPSTTADNVVEAITRTGG